MAHDRDAEILDALLKDTTFNFKNPSNGKTLTQGVCPDCGQKTVWVKKEKPGRVWCNRENNCGYTATTKELYPDLFENYAQRHPATEEDPNATARAYLADRGFNDGKIAGLYEQGYRPIGKGITAPTVRIRLWDDCYWERIIDKKHVVIAGRKNHFKKGTRIKNRHWEPKGFTLEDNDTCYITEGIFNAWVFMHEGKKAVASFSSNNLPLDLINDNRKRGIVWVLAYDNDKAGIGHVREYLKIMDEYGETCQVMLTASNKRDWNDEYERGVLNDRYMADALWRGQIVMADKARDKAFWLWARYPKNRIQLEFGHALYTFKVADKAEDEVYDALGMDRGALDFLWTNPKANVEDARYALSGKLAGSRISNCLPRFLYIERDPLTEDQDYFFHVSFRNGNPARLIALDGSALESAGSLNKALLGKTSGGTFDGDAQDIKKLKEQWFDNRTTEITRVRFVGYDKDSNAWVYPGFGFHGGRFVPLNEMGFINAGPCKVKTKVSSAQIKMIHADQLDESWIGTFEQTFGPNGMVVMAWWLCTLYAEQIRATYQDWPFLELTGDPGTGKTTLLKFLWRCCGRIDGYEGFDPAQKYRVWSFPYPGALQRAALRCH